MDGYSDPLIECPNRNEVVVSDRTYVGNLEGQEGARSPGGGDELDLEAVWGINLDDRPEIPGPEPMRRQVANEHNRVEQSNIHDYLPGMTVTRRG